MPDDQFIYDDSSSYSSVISYQSKNKGGIGYGGNPVVLGKLIKYRQPDKWYISTIGDGYSPRTRPEHRMYVSKEEGANILLYMKKAMILNPLSDMVRDYLEDQCDQLRRELDEARGRFYSIQRKRRLLAEIANKNGLDFKFDGDIRKEAADLLAFINEDIDLIYKKLGKDWARGLRAHVSSLVQCVDPLAATEV